MKNLRIEAAIKNVDWQLQGWVPGRRRRQIRDELRANLREAAGDVGYEEAVRRLGGLRELAAEYLEAERRRVNIRAGIFSALVVFEALALLWYCMLASFRAGADAGRAGMAEASVGPFSFSGDPGLGGASYGLDVAWPLWVLLPLLAFVSGSQAWRLLRH
jgi:hypothetical protein